MSTPPRADNFCKLFVAPLGAFAIRHVGIPSALLYKPLQRRCLLLVFRERLLKPVDAAIARLNHDLPRFGRLIAVVGVHHKPRVRSNLGAYGADDIDVPF